MQSKIIERMLTENNKTLQEIINVVKDNAIFNAAMRDIKDGYFVDDEIHGMSHNERVTLLACYIGIKEDLSDEELKLVLEAAKYHDIGRGYEVNHNHGQFSTVIIDRNKEYIFPSLDDNEINIIKALCHGHSIDDKRYEEIARLYGIKDIKQIKKLLDIVKDADALDRVRLQRFGKLDEKYLRTDTSKGLTEFAENLFREYRNIQQEILAEDKKTESTYSFSTELRDQLLFDGENYYLLRSLNRADIDSLNSGNGIIPKIDSLDAHTVQDVMAQIRMQHRKTNLISMSEEPNIVLTYDKSNLHRFVLIRLSKEEIEDSKKVFSAGEYLLGVMDSEIERIVTNAPEKVREIIENVDKATSIEEIVKIINGADRQVPTSLVETQQQYLSSEEQLNQSKKIAKCKVLNYYGLMRGIAHDEKGKLIDISGFTQIMRNGFSSSEWLYSGKIPQDKIINIPQILIDSLALLKQAEFQGKDKEIIRKIEKEVLDLAISGEKINQDNYQLEYSAHNDLKNDLTIDKAFEITNGEISYRDTNMQQIAIRSLAEMTLNKRRIIELLKERLPDIDIEGLLSDTYCINQEMVTRQNNKGSQIGRNINFLISDYGYDFDEETSRRILESVENLTDEQLKSIISQGINAQEISNLLIKIRGKEERIETTKYKKKSVKYLAEAIVEGYNWKKDSNSLTKKEKELLAKDLLRGEKIGNGLYELYEAINKIQIGKNKFTQNEVFAIIINLAIDGKIGDILYSDLLRKDIREIQHILLDYKEELQTSVLPISMDLLAGKGKEIDRLKKELIDLGIDKEFIESKDIKNVYIAKKIVEEYIFERDISTKEKASLIKAVLKNNKLNSDSSYHLTSLILNMEQIGLATQEIYGMIINLGVNENIIEETGYAYSSLLGNINNACQTIAEFKDKIQTKVTEGTIHVAVSENLNKEEQEQIKSELIELGIDREFIESKKIKNIYSAKQIVEKYKFGRAINTKEKASLIKAILNNSKLNNNNSSNLTTFIQNMEQIGLSTQEIYGMIINLGINGSVLEELGYDYSSMLGNTNNVCQTIAQYKDRIQTKVTAGTIDVAVSENLNKEEQEQIRSELIELGIDKEFIELKGTKNIYIAKQIVERYDFERDINVKEKASLIKAILNKSVLNTDRRIYLTTLVQNMERIGLSTREICGLIINLGVNGKVLEETGYDYSYLLANTKDSCQTIAQYKDRIQTKVTAGTIDVAVSENLNKKEQEQIKYELVELGIDSEFIELKDIKNIYIAKQIVERYDFERDINVKEKASLIKAILNNSGLNADRSLYLTTLVQNMEQIGLSTQEIYGMIINLCTNGKVLEETGYGYADLLANTKNACQTIAQYKDRIQTKVTVGTIDTAGFGNLNEIEKKQIKTELIELGIDREFIESKKTKNIYFAKQIVEKYEFGIDINAKEKASLIKAILNNSALNSEKTSNLITFIQNMEQIGLSTQEIYGMIINLSVNGSALEKTGYNYKSLLCNTNNACQTIAEFKDKIQTKVTESTIDVAVCKNLNKNEQEQIRSELIELGIEKEFLESKDIKNIYFAKQIVEKYNFEREISKEEKASLIKAILNNSRLNKNRGCYITKLIQSAEQIGLSTQEIYGMIINLGVNEKVLEKGGYSYSLLLQNKDNALQTIAQYRDEIQIEVTEETIQKAVKKANQPKKVKGQDIAKATMELTVKGSGGSQICDDVQADYMRLLDEKTNNNQKEGSEQGDEN